MLALDNKPMQAYAPMSWQRWAGLGLVFALAYFVSGRLGLSLSVVENNVTLIWPPTGLALFALVVFGLRFWPWILVGSLATTLSTGIAWGGAISIAVGNTLEAVVAFYLLRMAGFQSALPRVRDVVALVMLAAGLSTMVSATLGAATLGFWGVMAWDQFPKAWLSWWMGDAMGDLVFASFLFSWWPRTDRRRSTARMAEAVLLAVCLIGVSQLVLGGYFTLEGRPLPLAFATFPILIWAALRFGMRGATVATLLIGAVALITIIHGSGLFAQGESFESLFLLWLYMNVSAVTGMALAASVSERRQAEEGMRHLARHDALTGLPSRATLADRIDQAILHADRRHCPAAVLFVDVDRFKVINDSLGHSAGDEFLIQAARRLRQSVRDEDTVTRQGGDEFVIVLDDVNYGEDVVKVAHKILEAMREPFSVQGTPLHVTVSIGVSLYPADGKDAETLLTNADIAMYRAKDLGRNGHVFYSSEMNARAVERLALENRLRGALERGEFLLYFQPQYDARNGQVLGAEALLRWRNEQGELLPPAVFIPLLEETGLINRVGAWVIDHACEQLAHWHERGWDELRLAINISSRQVSDAALPEQVASALARWKLAPTRLELEITESLLVRQDATTEKVMQRLVDLGVLLAVDDFGTGYSSLSYLHRLSIDTLKIDRAFVTDIPANEDGVAIARAIIGLGQSLHLNLVAEGVETPEQHAFLRELGCHMMQGYLFSRPLPATEFVALLEANRAAVRA